ncbi:MAG: FHA domain-containing protein [Chitinophagaceae bacterium]|nr:FHA domain-containing protein [Anaerolineae bacterium]
MLIGRSADGEEQKSLSLDLGPFGAYQGGVSRQHAAITRHEGGLYVEDLGSTNGTRINGFQLTARRKYRLRDGDEVEFARLRTLIRFVRPSDDISS